MTIPPADTKDYMTKLAYITEKFLPDRKSLGKPESFGVYLGTFSNPITTDEERLLTQWHTIIIDPTQIGVLEALSSSSKIPTYVIGRIDVAALTVGVAETDCLAKIKIITETILQMRSSDDPSPFNGVLIANWDNTLTPGICNEIIGFLHGLNLHVYNEISEPGFMDELNSALKIELLSGVVFVNGAIMPNGERRDYFNMLSMKSALEIVTAQSCLRSEFGVLMCEIVSDDSPPTNAVVKRSFKWCSFYGAVMWIGTQRALKDASMNVFVREPDGAFEWLKRDAVMEVHEIWKSNSKVIPYSH
jgi:hypothetical protein